MNGRSNCCFTVIVLLLITICCVLGSCAGMVQAKTDECMTRGTWLLLIPGEETQIVGVWPGEGGYKIAKAKGILIIWQDGDTAASVRIGEKTYHGTVGLSYPETKYCGAIMLQLKEQFYIEDPVFVSPIA